MIKSTTNNILRNLKLKNTQILLIITLLIILLILSSLNIVLGQPTGIDITFNNTEIITPEPAAELTTEGGSFTTLILNGTFQTPRWKAYVGNVSGRLTLDDSTSRTIYDWDLITVSGQVYVTRNNSVDWSSIECANEQSIINEQSYLNIVNTSADSINKTFNETIHKDFFVGTRYIAESSCRAIATYVEDSKQEPSVDATFQEILLKDNQDNIVFTTIIEQAQTGYDSKLYDFQLIVPEDPTANDPTTYYFFAEIY